MPKYKLFLYFNFVLIVSQHISLYAVYLIDVKKTLTPRIKKR